MLCSTGMKPLPMFIFYCVNGAVGNIFGALCNSSGALFVGCIPACFGMFAAMISTLAVNWHALAAYPQMKCPLIFIMVIFTMCLMLNSTTNQNVTPFYHPHAVWSGWGGFINGLFLGLIMVPRARARDNGPNSYGRLCTYIGLGWLLVFYAIIFSCYFTVYDPLPWYTS